MSKKHHHYPVCRANALGACAPGEVAVREGLCQGCWDYVNEFPPGQYEHDPLSLPDPRWQPALADDPDPTMQSRNTRPRAGQKGDQNSLARWAEIILPGKPEEGEVIDPDGSKSSNRQHHHPEDGRIRNGQHNREKLTCPAGHKHDKTNNRGARYCSECRKLRYQARQAELGREVRRR